ncbi:MAG: Ca-activated chloride channel [Acidimicrobiaceae bacterium]
MDYLEPSRLWFLFGVIALAAIYLAVQQRRHQYAVRFTNVALLDAVVPKRPGWRRHVTALAFLAAIAATVVAFARPTHDVKVPREKATVVLAIDTSLSMDATDVSPSRIDAAKSAAVQFLDAVPGTINVGLVSFDGAARVAVEPTTDRSKVRKAIDRLQLHQGTAIGEAIFASLDAIGSVKAQTDSVDETVPARIVLMSDGETTVGRANDDAVTAANTAQVPVSTIAFGTDHGEIVIPGPDGGPVSVPVNKSALNDIADSTGGSFFSAASEAQLAKVYADIGSSIGFTLEPREITMWFVGAALIAMMVTASLSLAWTNRLL